MSAVPNAGTGDQAITICGIELPRPLHFGQRGFDRAPAQKILLTFGNPLRLSVGGCIYDPRVRHFETGQTGIGRGY